MRALEGWWLDVNLASHQKDFRSLRLAKARQGNARQGKARPGTAAGNELPAPSYLPTEPAKASQNGQVEGL